MTDNGNKEYYDRRSRRTGNTAYQQNLRRTCHYRRIYDVKLSEVHGMAQRGGSVVTFVRYGEQVAEPIVEEGRADVIIAFERLEALRYAHFLKKTEH